MQQYLSINGEKMNIKINRLIECRKKIGITKQEAAKRIGVAQPTYLRYESGTRTPSLHVIKDIAKVFNTSVEYLIGETDSSDADYIIINKNTEPEIFQILNQRNNWNKKQLKQLLAYAQKLNGLSSDK